MPFYAYIIYICRCGMCASVYACVTVQCMCVCSACVNVCVYACVQCVCVYACVQCVCVYACVQCVCALTDECILKTETMQMSECEEAGPRNSKGESIIDRRASAHKAIPPQRTKRSCDDGAPLGDGEYNT